ncbi:MAG: phosphonate ABC transporter, permease protein PhnE [Pseudobdellovibrionaceae bacterium]
MNKHSVKTTIFDAIIFSYLLLVVWTQVISPSAEPVKDVGVNALLALGFFVAGAGASLALNKKSVRTLGESIFAPAYTRVKLEERPWYKTFSGWQLLIVMIVTMAVGFDLTRFSFSELFDEYGFEGAKNLFIGLATPNFAILPTAILNIIETVFIAFMATLMAIPIAFVLSFFCAKNIMKHPVAFTIYTVLRTLLNVTRSIEALIWAIIFSVWVGIGPFAGMLALMIHSIASLAKQYSEMVESVSEGPIEGIQSTGAGWLQTIWFAIVPQVILPYVSFTIYRWDINVRMATIIGLVGGGGIGTMLIKYQGQAMWHEVGCIIMVIAIVVWGMDQASAYLREAIK